MLGLKLRAEFSGKRLKGTAIELSNDSETGATQITATDFLKITYPTIDLLRGIEAVGPEQGRPIVVIGERGLGKSHLLAALYHAVKDPTATQAWLDDWSQALREPRVSDIPLRDKMEVIGESLHRQRYKFLWDLLFERHPHGTYVRGKWEGRGEAKTDVPSDELMLELFTAQPTMLLLDEFQTWYDGLTNTKQYPWKNWAFNFIQILSEIAKERPDLLVLVVSVRNGRSDAYQQIHRVNPIPIDFKGGGNAERIQRDRRMMLLHRLFENRIQVNPEQIKALLRTHIAEYFRLTDIPASEQERRIAEFVEAWPFAPHLLRLLEEQVLIATDAQETRDLIKILANLYRSRGEKSCLLTASDFRLDDDKSGILALLDSVANEHHRTLRDKANQNLLSVREALPEHRQAVPHLTEIMSALWLRSIAVGNLAGAEPSVLQADITREHAVDNNIFSVELSKIVENSFNIHQDGRRLAFREEENPRARIMVMARNDKLFTDGSDLRHLAKEVRYVVGGGEEVARNFRVLPLSKNWMAEPWSVLEEQDHPERWDGRIPILVLPEDSDRLDEKLGRWLKDHLQARRNTVRFLLPRVGLENLFRDHELLLFTRAALKAQEWSGHGSEYKKLAGKFQSDLREQLKKRFDRFAILERWNFADPRQCRFAVESLKGQKPQIPDDIDQAIRNNLFIPEDFTELVMEAARQGDNLGKLIKELQEPRPSGYDCIPWLGETEMKERIGKLCAQGLIAVNLRGMEYLQVEPGEDEDSAWRRLRPKFSVSGRHLDEVRLTLPSAVPATGGSSVVADSTPVEPTHYQTVTSLRGNLAPSVVAETSSMFGSSLFDRGRPKDDSGARMSFSNPATSPLNLLGKLEGWGIEPATPVEHVSLYISAATGAQLKELLKKLPDGMTFELSLEKAGD